MVEYVVLLDHAFADDTESVAGHRWLLALKPRSLDRARQRLSHSLQSAQTLLAFDGGPLQFLTDTLFELFDTAQGDRVSRVVDALPDRYRDRRILDRGLPHEAKGVFQVVLVVDLVDILQH